MRAFVVGGGPSLKHTDLDRLVGESTFAMNRIDLAYEADPGNGIRGTAWRPTYYLFAEHIGVGVKASQEWRHFSEYVLPHVDTGEQCIVRSVFKGPLARAAGGRLDWPNVTWFDNEDCEHHNCNIRSDNRPDRWHLPTLCAFGGTVGIAIQMAMMFGYDPIYLVGCDLGYKPVRGGPDPNHFHPDYHTWDTHPLLERDDTLVLMHAIAQREAEARGNHIFNATKGGKLEVHERVDYDGLF